MKGNDQLLRELEEAVRGLLFMSESDHPLEVVRWEGDGPPTPERLRREAGKGKDSPVETQEVGEFFRAAVAEKSYDTAEDRARAERFRRLASLLTEGLSGTLAYRVGEINIAVFVIGKGESGELIGVKTRVVET